MIQALERFSRAYPSTRVQLEEVVLTGGPELLREGRVDILIAPELPGGYLGTWLADQVMVCVAHPEHR